MNHHGKDRWCPVCRQIKPSEGFAPMRGTPIRMACAECNKALAEKAKHA